MLKSIEPTEQDNISFVVCDIECYAFPHPKEGEVIAIDTCWKEQEEIKHQKHDTWKEWWQWLCSISEKDKKFRTIYAHNGGGYDWISFVQYMLHEGKTEKQSMSAACSGSKMVTLNITVAKSHSIHLCDSLQLLRSKLDILGQVFLKRKKVELDGLLPHEIFQADPIKFAYYHREDCEILLGVMESALLMLRNKVTKIDTFGYTIGSTAMKVFRTMGMENEISIPTDDFLKSFLREAYCGGRVECFRAGQYEKICVYDINSLYPYAMRSTKVPISDRGFWTRKYSGNEVSCFHIKWKQNNTSIFPILMYKGNGVYSGEGKFFSPEIDLLIKLDPHCEIEFVKGYEFLECDYIFSGFVDKLYKLRVDNPDSPISMLCKFLLNSLYGKFGQHAERESIVTDTEIDLESLPEFGDTRVRIINPRLGVTGVTKDVHCNFEHVGIAGIITSFARVQLYNGILESGIEKVIYCDTDSVHTIGSMPSNLIGTALGQFKLEQKGEGVYAGKKLYGIRDEQGKEKVRVKGVSINGKFGAKVTFNDLVGIVKGEHKECLFKQFATPLEIFTEQSKAGVLRQRKRTIKRTS